MEGWQKEVVILGAGGFGREIAEIGKRMVQSSRDIELLGFLDDNNKLHGKYFNNLPVLGSLGHFKGKENIYFMCSIGNPMIRRLIVEKVLDYGYIPISIVDPSVVKFSGIKIGKGVVINVLCGIMANVIVEDHVHINLLCSIGHDVKIEEFSTINPGVCISGDCIIKEGSYIGTNASILQGITIGENAKVGAGACVIRDVEPNTTVVGIPAKNKNIKKYNIEDHHAYT